MKTATIIFLLATACGGPADLVKPERPKLTIISHGHETAETLSDETEARVHFYATLSDEGIKNYHKRFAINLTGKLPANCNEGDKVESYFAGGLYYEIPLGTEVAYLVCAHDGETGYLSDPQTAAFIVGDE